VNELNNDYIPPILNSTNVDSEQFANNGPRNIDFSAGSDVIFNFSGLQQGSSSIDFIEISFQMLPTSGSSKSSTSRSVFFPVNDDMEFIINIDSITTGKAYKSTEWESGYRYIFSELNVFDQITKTKFKSNGQIIFDDQRSNTTHNVYYLDQFSFNIP